MKGIDLFNALTMADENVTERTAARREMPLKRRIHITKLGIAAACIALALIGTALLAFAKETKAYNDAVKYFEANGLSTEGLSRGEIKAVYRDIITETYSLDKTADVLAKSVPGLEIEQNKSRSDTAEAIPHTGKGLTFNTSFTVSDEPQPYDNLENGVLICYLDGKKIWTASFPKILLNGYSHSESGTAVWGYRYTTRVLIEGEAWTTDSTCFAALVDNDGNIVWQNEFSHDGFRFEAIHAAVDNGDGTWEIFTHGTDNDEQNYLGLMQVGKDGRDTGFYKAKIDSCNINEWNVVRLGDEYLVQAGDSTNHQAAKLMRVDRKANVSDNFSFCGENEEYTIKEMTVYGGKVYMSADAYPKREDAGGRHDIAGVLEYAYSLHEAAESVSDGISTAELAKVMKDNFTAVLLICDGSGKEPETFYSVKGSFGGNLMVSNKGELEWYVYGIRTAEYHPMLSSHSFDGTCDIFRYTFNEGGEILSQTDTGEVYQYMK